MVQAQIRIIITQDTITKRLIDLKTKDYSPVLRLIGETHTRKVQIRFDTEKDPYGRPWKPRKDPYAGLSRKKRKSAKRKPTKNRPILYLTGRLRLSVIYQLLPNAKGVAIGTNVVYAATHEFGDSRRGIPQRSFLGITPADIKEYRSLIIDYLAGRLE